MHRVKRFAARILGKRSALRKEASTSLKVAEPEVHPISRLPVELLLHILAFADRGSLFELLHASRIWRTLASPFYFRSLELDELIGPEHPRTLRGGYLVHMSPATILRRMRILVLVCDPVRGSSVTRFRAKMTAPPICRRYEKHDTYDRYETCTCFVVDEMIGDALKQMINLENLHLSCKLCSTWESPRHQYMRQLPTKRLRILSFECNCTHSPSFALGMAPPEHSLQELTTLRWDSRPPYAHLLTWQVDSREIPFNLSAAPRLRSLYLTGTIDESTLSIRRGPMRLLVDHNYGYESIPMLRRAINQSSVMLTYISMSKLDDVVDLMSIKPSAFVRLQHLGTVSFPHPQDGVISFPAVLSVIDHICHAFQWMEPLKPFESLRHLESLTLELAREDDSHFIDGCCQQLRSRHPKLRKVFCHNFPSHVWILKGKAWERIAMLESNLDWEHRADDVLGWNILKEVYDHL